MVYETNLVVYVYRRYNGGFVESSEDGEKSMFLTFHVLKRKCAVPKETLRVRNPGNL